MKNTIRNILRKVYHSCHIQEFINYIKYLIANERFDMDYQTALEILSKCAPMPKSTAITTNILEKPYSYDLTIIIPAYNSEKWIKECMDSVVSQKTHYKFCVKVVNDGSKDQTRLILKQYESDPRVMIIDQENRGYSGARNRALKTISSRYIMFVDSDDRLEPGAIENLMQTAEQNNADIVEGSAYAFNEEVILYEIKKENCLHTQVGLWGGPCFKVIRSELFERIELPEGYLYEDSIFGYLVYPQAKTISTISNMVYAYRIHLDSITQSHTANVNRVDSYWIMVLINKNMEELSINKNELMYISTMRHIILTYRRTSLLNEEIKKCIFACARNFLIENYEPYLKGKGKYYRLSNAIISRQFGKYCVLCETHKL